VGTVTWTIELGVGIACLVIGVGALRGPRLLVVGALLIVAGLAASGHALAQMLLT
jgi:hypothetical protein